MHSPPSTRRFYDAFSRTLLLDYLRPNERIILQRAFLREAIPASVRSVAFVGCGTGQVMHDLVRVAPRAQWLGADLSAENIALAQRLFGGRRVRFVEHDILASPIPGRWDVIVFPDSYEHIPRAERPTLHKHISEMLAPEGRVLLTCPSVPHQRVLRETGRGLQPVDEDVELGDIQRLALDVGASVTHFSMVQVWGTYDYFHAEIERGVESQRSFQERIPTRLHRGRSFRGRLWSLSVGQDGLLRLPLRGLRAAFALRHLLSSSLNTSR